MGSKTSKDGSVIFEDTQRGLDCCSCVGADVVIGDLVWFTWVFFETEPCTAAQAGLELLAIFPP